MVGDLLLGSVSSSATMCHSEKDLAIDDARVSISLSAEIVKTKCRLQLGKDERKERSVAPPRGAGMGVIYECALGTHEKRMPLILRIMFGKPLDILKYGKVAQIRRVEMNVTELEGI